jgi:hypothetical protein
MLSGVLSTAYCVSLRRMRQMMQITEVVVSDDGKIVGFKGRGYRTSRIFSITTDKVIFWAEFGLEYFGG